MNPEQQAHARVTRLFSTSPERLFDACLDPAMVPAWMLAPGGEMVSVKLEARPGGSFSFVVRRNGQEIDHVGQYLEIDRPRRLVFTWGIAAESSDTSRVIIEIVRLETGSELTLTHELHPNWADFVSRAEAAWSKMLGAMAAALS